MRSLIAVTAYLAFMSPVFAQAPSVALQLVTDTLDAPVFATAPANDPRLFVVEQTGRIRIVAGGQLRDEPFLDLSDKVSSGGEQGLLGLAFHPDYATNGQFYVNYTDQNGTTQVAEFTVSADPDVADPATEVILLSVEQPYANHNGGWIGFGPDGGLYVGMGDGGSGGDPRNRSQNADELLGKILRLDVTAAGAPDIFALGVRNPWRMAFDGDQLYVADVGQNQWEEISVVSIADERPNLGWKVMEGPACFEQSSCDQSGLVLPIHSYSHDTGGCSITGGYVYRGAAIPQLVGQYFFADFCDGRIRSIPHADGATGAETDWSETLGVPGQITSFGLDSAAELHVMTADGQLLKLVAKP